MFYSVKLYIRDSWIFVPLALIATAQAAIWWLLISGVHPDSSGQIFLHYNIIFGIDLVGDWWNMYFLPAAGLLVVLANFFLSLVFYAQDRFLARLVSVWTVFFHAFLLAAVIFLVRLNV